MTDRGARSYVDPDPSPAAVPRLALGLLSLALLAPAAHAQRPFASFETLYHGESARRAFYDGFAVSGGLDYRNNDATQVLDGGGLAIQLHGDYAVTRGMDVGATMTAAAGQPLRLAWLIAKPYWRTESGEYAIRVAVDPGSGGLGFRQTDVAFVSSADLSPMLSSDFAIGFRAVRVGYERLVEEPIGDPGTDAALAGLVRTRAIGREIRAMWHHDVQFDLGGSSAFLTLLAEAGDYHLLESETPAPTARAAEDAPRGRYRSAAGRVRAGLRFSRPSYQVAPYFAFPVVLWSQLDGDSRTLGPSPTRVAFGCHVMLR